MWWRRVGWFVLLWFAGISVVGIVAWMIRAMIL